MAKGLFCKIDLPESLAENRITNLDRRKTFMKSEQQLPITFHANKEHSGVRFVVIIVLGAAYLAAFIGLNLILSSMNSGIAEFATGLSCLLALPLALGFAAITERYLKLYWPSGQRVELIEQGVVAYPADGKAVAVDWSARFTVLKWFFGIKGYALGGRERRLPKNYYCLALQLQQDKHRFVVYTYLPVSRVTPIMEGKEFLEIKPGDHYKGGRVKRWVGSTDRPKIPTSVLAGSDGVYWIAERRRWAEGLELEPSDFQVLLDMVEKKFVEWDDLGPE
jgi:hypothetical protein